MSRRKVRRWALHGHVRGLGVAGERCRTSYSGEDVRALAALLGVVRVFKGGPPPTLRDVERVHLAYELYGPGDVQTGNSGGRLLMEAIRVVSAAYAGALQEAGLEAGVRRRIMGSADAAVRRSLRLPGKDAW
ncbi:hypothetical protein AGRA3207_000786 [Actinomadura graeca]|uniref:HTH merR-type domain-containing protein n=1 Tax=Actinomadura graeca TaxID=2750812 RepID=A0ABX8QN75_9ACTN|nr:hypothetical protein [Actinomadura graeca]QXJ20132.1 hypothetical protein AGRA3207_000786 [Actinomadura graeca]